MPSGKAESPILVRPARAGELPKLSLLCLRSKAIWGYNANFIAACRARLTLRPEDLAATCLAVAVRRGHAVGLAQVTPSGATATMNKLFVEPAMIGTGVGTALFADAAQSARRSGAAELLIASDPGAAGFFRRMGATETDAGTSDCIPGQRLVRFVLRF